MTLFDAKYLTREMSEEEKKKQRCKYVHLYLVPSTASKQPVHLSDLLYKIQIGK